MNHTGHACCSCEMQGEQSTCSTNQPPLGHEPQKRNPIYTHTLCVPTPCLHSPQHLLFSWGPVLCYPQYIISAAWHGEVCTGKKKVGGTWTWCSRDPWRMQAIATQIMAWLTEAAGPGPKSIGSNKNTQPGARACIKRCEKEHKNYSDPRQRVCGLVCACAAVPSAW